MDTRTTLAYIAESLKLTELAFNHDGDAELVLNDDFSVYISKIDENFMEMSLFLPDLDEEDPGLMRIMLEANCLGNHTKIGRMAIDPQKGKALYCERWDVRNFSEKVLDEYLKNFVEQALFWATQGTNDIIEKANEFDIKSDFSFSSKPDRGTGFLSP